MIGTMIPEEIVIVNQMIAKHGLQVRLSQRVEKYIIESMDEMETLELSKVYMSCIKNNLELSEPFKA